MERHRARTTFGIAAGMTLLLWAAPVAAQPAVSFPNTAPAEYPSGVYPPGGGGMGQPSSVYPPSTVAPMQPSTVLPPNPTTTAPFDPYSGAANVGPFVGIVTRVSELLGACWLWSADGQHRGSTVPGSDGQCPEYVADDGALLAAAGRLSIQHLSRYDTSVAVSEWFQLDDTDPLDDDHRHTVPDAADSLFVGGWRYGGGRFGD